jgi:nitrate reductase beta subunit
MSRTHDGLLDAANEELFSPIDKARLPISYLARLFSAGNTEQVAVALRKQYAVRLYKRFTTVGDIDERVVRRALAQLEMSEEEAEAIYRLTSLPAAEQRFVIPPSHREVALEMLNEDMWAEKGENGFGFRERPRRGM